MFFNEIREVLGVRKTYNVEENVKFTYFRIVNIETKKLVNREKVLFFPIYITKEDLKEGWYIKEYDLRNIIIEQYKRNPEYYYVIELNMLKELPSDIKSFMKIIVVNNIMESIEKLFTLSLSKFHGRTIMVTGSVGKTSMTGILENMLKTSNKTVLRIYSKRITPIVLKAFIINFIEDDLEYIVMEAGMFYKKHIPYFAKTMQPYLSVILNVEEEHIGIDGIESKHDIVKNKAEIIKYSNYVIINGNDSNLAKLRMENDILFYKDEELFSTNAKLIYWKKGNELIRPYIKTKLAFVMTNIAYMVGNLLELSENSIIYGINNYSSVENRLTKQKIMGKEIIFDGDVSGVARIKMLCNHYYEKAVFIIRNLTKDSEEEEKFYLLKADLEKFQKVYIFNNVYEKKYFVGKKFVIVYNHDFMNKIDEDYVIFYHYGSYFRHFEKFSIDNLKREI